MFFSVGGPTVIYFMIESYIFSYIYLITFLLKKFFIFARTIFLFFLFYLLPIAHLQFFFI